MNKEQESEILKDIKEIVRGFDSMLSEKAMLVLGSTILTSVLLRKNGGGYTPRIQEFTGKLHKLMTEYMEEN